MGSTPQVLVVEDDPPTRTSYEELLRLEGFEARGFAHAEAVLADGNAARAGLILSDLRLGPGLDGIGLVRALRAASIRTPVIVVSGHGDIPLAVAAMRAGASDFLEKPVEPVTLIAVIRAALENNTSQQAAGHSRDRLTVLTGREREVMSLLALGLPNKEVARRLGISPRTVETYRATIMDKLALGNFADLVRLGLKAGLHPEPD